MTRPQPRPALRPRSPLAACALLLAGALALPARAEPAPLPWQPYKDITQGLRLPDHRLHSVAGDQAPQALVDAQGTSRLPGRPPEIVWAFARGTCGREQWAPGVRVGELMRANADAQARAGLKFRISTGGELGVFTCADRRGMEAFIGHYRHRALAGFDFDIEGRQTPAEIDALVREAAAAARRHPTLDFSFTLATLAASDGSGAGFNATGQAVMQAITRHRFSRARINLMVMNYGPASAAHCVLADEPAPRCDMGRSGLQAAENLHQRFGVPYGRIALTAMLGRNDVAGNVFRPQDARWLQAAATARGLAGLYVWSLDRDAPCPADTPLDADGLAPLSPRCHSLPGVEAGRFGGLR